MPAIKGQPNPGAFGQPGRKGGRPKGVPNKITLSAKAAFQAAFDELGGTEALKAWAVANPTDFFKLYSKLIPTEVSGADGAGLVVQIVRLSDGTAVARS